MTKIYGREPAAWMAGLGALWGVLSAFGLDFDPKLQSIVTAAVSAALGLVVAVQVGDGIIAAFNGLLVAGMSLVSYFGFDWSSETQAKFVGAVTVLTALLLTRPAVIAPVGPEASPPGRLVA